MFRYNHWLTWSIIWRNKDARIPKVSCQFIFLNWINSHFFHFLHKILFFWHTHYFMEYIPETKTRIRFRRNRRRRYGLDEDAQGYGWAVPRSAERASIYIFEKRCGHFGGLVQSVDAGEGSQRELRPVTFAPFSSQYQTNLAKLRTIQQTTLTVFSAQFVTTVARKTA